MNDADDKPVAINARSVAKFAIPSILSLLLFLIPVTIDGESTLLISVAAALLKTHLAPILPALILFITLSSATLSIYCAFQPHTQGLLGKRCNVEWYWMLLRIIGAMVAFMVFFQLGPQAVWGQSTGSTMVNQLVPTVMTLFLAVIFLLPLMTEFGIMEFVGVWVARVFRLLFRLPGRGAIDAMASWLGAAPLGVVVTTEQYERGYYSRREALSIVSSFSLASVAFCLLIATLLRIEHLFLPFYGSVAIASVVLATVVCRIPPLSRIADDFHCESSRSELVPEGYSTGRWALGLAVKRAANAAPPKQQLQESGVKLLDLWFGLIPTVIAIGTLSLMLAEYTPIFNWISLPFRYYLELLGVPEAAAAAPSMVVGFADMILPAILGGGIESEFTRFVIAGVSVTQVIYMSEIGALLLRSKMQTSVWQLAAIFLVRTVFAIPLFVLLGHLFLD